MSSLSKGTFLVLPPACDKGTPDNFITLQSNHHIVVVIQDKLPLLPHHIWCSALYQKL
jgi:hypothetical protein